MYDETLPAPMFVGTPVATSVPTPLPVPLPSWCGIAIPLDSEGITNEDFGVEIDDCGICGGDNSSCADCFGTPNGEAFEDDCGECSGGLSDHEANSDIDCNDVCFGTADWDDCGVCAGGNTGLVANADKDCNGDC